MNIEATAIDGVHLLSLQTRGDERGFFARMFCRQRFLDAGLEPAVEQGNLSFSQLRGTVRGLHYQRAPHAETKLVRCTRGAILDVAVDLRSDSPTYLHHVAVRLSADNRQALYIPRHCAHGFQTLEPDTEVSYLVSSAYAPEAEAGLRHDDPVLAIDWPEPVSVLSDKDATWPLVGRS